jgi:Phospholipase_D-nuclease N-terminal
MFMSNLSNILSLLISAFVFFAYVMLMSQIVIDLFRDQDLSGGKKALWIIALILLPFITALVYIVTRGKGMAQRYRSAAERSRDEAAAYLREVGGSTSVDQITRAKTLLDQGVINNDEFVALKRGALSHAGA